MTSALIHVDFGGQKVNVLNNKPRKANLHFNTNQITEFYTQIMVKEELDVINNAAATTVMSALILFGVRRNFLEDYFLASGAFIHWKVYN